MIRRSVRACLAISFAILLILTGALDPGTASAATGYLHLGGYSAQLGGDLTDGEDTRERTEVDLGDDIGFGFDFAVEARAGVELGRGRLQAAAAIFDHEVNRSDASFTFEGTTFEADARVTNHLRWVEGEYGFAAVNSKWGRLEVLAGVRLFRYEGEAEGRRRLGPIDVQATASAEETGPVPHIGVALSLRPFERLALRGYAKGLSIGLKDDRGKELDVEVTLGLRVLPVVEIGGGFRHLNLFASLDSGSTTIDLRYQAVTAYLRFGR